MTQVAVLHPTKPDRQIGCFIQKNIRVAEYELTVDIRLSKAELQGGNYWLPQNRLVDAPIAQWRYQPKRGLTSPQRTMLQATADAGKRGIT